MVETDKTREQLIHELTALCQRIAQLETIDITRQRLASRVDQEHKLKDIKGMPNSLVNEFNNILTVMLGYTELSLHDVPQDSAIWHRLQHILAAGKRAKNLVQQISIYSSQTS